MARHKKVTYISASVLLVGIVFFAIFIIWKIEKESHELLFLPSPQTIPGVYVPEKVLVDATSTSIENKEELVLYSAETAQNVYDAELRAPCASGSYTWQKTTTRTIFLNTTASLDTEHLDCKPTGTFDIEIRKAGIVLVEESTGRAWRRKPYYSFEYKEEGMDKRLTLYQVPKCDANVCVGTMQGVFEKKDIDGVFKFSTTSEVESFAGQAVELFGQDDSSKNPVVIGNNKRALLLPWGEVHMGVTLSGEYLLEYGNEKLQVTGSFLLDKDYEGVCGGGVESKLSVEETCPSYTGTIITDTTVTHHGYYDIIVKKKGTDFDYGNNKIVSVEPEERYSFDSKGSSYALNSFYEDATITTTDTRGNVVKVGITSCKTGEDELICFGSGRKRIISQGNLYLYSLVSSKELMGFGVVLVDGEKNTNNLKTYLYDVMITRDNGTLSESNEDYLLYKNFVLNYFAKKYLSKESANFLKNNSIINEKDLLGSWVMPLANQKDPECREANVDETCFPNDSTEIHFDIVDGKKQFNSWLHRRPDVGGCMWSLNKNTITLACENTALSGNFTIASFSSTTITIDSEGLPLPGVYKKFLLIR